MLVSVGACSAPTEGVPPGWAAATAHAAAPAPPQVVLDGTARTALLHAWDGTAVPSAVPTSLTWDGAPTLGAGATSLTVGLEGAHPPERAVLQTFSSVDASGIPVDVTAETLCTSSPDAACLLRHRAGDDSFTLELPPPPPEARYATLQLTWLDPGEDGTVAELWATWGLVVDDAG